MPLFLHALLAWCRRKPLLALIGSGLVGWIVYWQMAPVTPIARPMATKASMLPGLGEQRAVMEKNLLDAQRDNALIRQHMDEQDRTLKQVQQALAKSQQDRETADKAQEARLEDVLKRAQQAQKAPPPAATRPAPAPKVAPPTPQKTEEVPHSESGAKVRILRSEKAASFAGVPPAINRGEIPYLPAGSFSVGKVITGVMATSRAGGALPMLFSVTREFTTPFQQQGPGYDPLAAAIAIQGCFVLGKSAADLSASRVIIQLELLSCVWPGGETYERPIRGYATDKDGTLGIVGRVETHDSAVIAKSFLTGLLAGASESFNLAKRTTLVTPLGGTVNTQQGQYGESAGFGALAQAASQLSQFYLSQASQLLPTLWVESGVSARLILQEGVSLEGLPTSITISSRGLRE
jgi:hypothetical protein